jgi:thiol-disulfide isomerase/thioredoxin
MHLSIPSWMIATSVWLAVGLRFAGGEPPAAVQLGDAPSYTFRSVPVNSLGARSLSDFRDRPVLIEFWGRRCPVCLGGSVPAALKLQESFGDDLTVLFVESQGATRDEVESFAIERRWMGGRAVWTTERPFEIRARSLPYFVLLGRDGRVISMGDPIAAHKEIDRRVADEIGRSEPVPGERTLAVRAAWGEFQRGRAADALADLRQLARATEPEAPALAARTALAELTARLERDVARAEWLLDHGFFEEARARAEGLRRSLRGDAVWMPRLDELMARFDSPELAQEREAARWIGRAVTQFFNSGGDAASAEELIRLAERHPTTRAAAEARRLVALIAR